MGSTEFFSRLRSYEGLCQKHVITTHTRWESNSYWGPQGFWGSGENGYLFSGSWGALVIILGELGGKLIILGI